MSEGNSVLGCREQRGSQRGGDRREALTDVVGWVDNARRTRREKVEGSGNGMR